MSDQQWNIKSQSTCSRTFEGLSRLQSPLQGQQYSCDRQITAPFLLHPILPPFLRLQMLIPRSLPHKLPALYFILVLAPQETQTSTYDSWFLNALSRLVVSDSLPPRGLQPARLLCPQGFSKQEYWCGSPCPLPGHVPNLEIKSRFDPALQADSLPTEPTQKPPNTGVGSLSLHQGIFPTQESNWGLLHCRWIFYQLDQQGSPGSPICKN